MKSKVLYYSFFVVTCTYALVLAGCKSACKTAETSGNPLWEGWYADPEGVVVDGECWIYPTTSARYRQQRWFDAFSSRDLVHWTKHERVLNSDDIAWFRQALWAPAMVKRGDTYYLYFAAYDVNRSATNLPLPHSPSDFSVFPEHPGYPELPDYPDPPLPSQSQPPAPSSATGAAWPAVRPSRSEQYIFFLRA